jgi:hypothetical protein
MIIGVSGHLSKGFKALYPQDIDLIYSQRLGGWGHSECYFSGAEYTFNDVASCVSDNTVFLIGDSHAESISGILSSELQRNNIRLVTLTHPGCFPVLGTTRVPASAHSGCASYKTVLSNILDNFSNPVIFSTRWRFNLEGTRFNNLERGVEPGPDNGLNVLSSDVNLSVDIYDYVFTYFDSLAADRSLIIVNQIPEAGWNVFDYALRRFINEDFNEEISTSYALYQSANADVIHLLERLEDRAVIIRTDDLVCSDIDQRCLNTINGIPLYIDDDHPSPLFAELIAAEIVVAATAAIENMLDH